MEAASDSVPGIFYALAVALQVLPLAVLLSFAPALLASWFFFVTAEGKRSAAFGNAGLAFIIALAAVAVTSATGLYVIGWKPGARSDADVVRSLVMQYSVHSVIFYLVGAWLVAQTWKRSRVAAAFLGTLIVAIELSLVLSEPFAMAALHPLVALSHAAAYGALLVGVVWWTRRSDPTRQAA